MELRSRFRASELFLLPLGLSPKLISSILGGTPSGRSAMSIDPPCALVCLAPHLPCLPLDPSFTIRQATQWKEEEDLDPHSLLDGRWEVRTPPLPASPAAWGRSAQASGQDRVTSSKALRSEGVVVWMPPQPPPSHPHFVLCSAHQGQICLAKWHHYKCISLLWTSVPAPASPSRLDYI